MKSNLPAKILAIAVVIMMAAVPLSVCTANGYTEGAVSDQQNSLPSSFNIDVSKGYTDKFPIRDQGSIGTCWAHGASATMEVALYMSDDTYSGRISPLAIASTLYDRACHANEIPEKTEGEDIIYVVDNSLTKIDVGGFATDTILGISSGKIAVVPEGSMSYTLASMDLQYNDDELSDLSSIYVVKSVEIYDMIRDPETIKTILTQGYVGCVDYKSINSKYGGGLMESRDYTPYYESSYGGTDHAVTLVGWDDNYSKDNFKEGITPENNGAWILRNSWGTTAEFNGYTYVSYETIIGKVFFVKEIENICTEDGLTKTYCYDFGVSSNKDIILNKSASMANIFTSSQLNNSEELKGISFTTFSKTCWAVGEEYKVSVYALDSDYECPTDGELLAVKSGKVDASGLEYVEFDKPVELSKGMKFSVVVDLSNKDGSIIIPVDTDNNENSIISYTTANPGESWTYINGEWKDISADHTSNVRIKAYTTTKIDGNGDVISIDEIKNQYVRYSTISDALDAGMKDLYLLSDLTLTEQVEVTGTESVSISLNGNTITYSGSGAAFVSELESDDEVAAKFSVINGTIVASETAFEGTGLSLLFVNIYAGADKNAVKADDSLDLVYSYVDKGNVTVRPTAASEDSKIIADIRGTLDIGPCYNSKVSIEGGQYAGTVFDHDAVAIIKYGSFSNNIVYNNAPGVNIIVGEGLGKVTSVITEMMDNRHGDSIVLTGDTTKGYNFVLSEISDKGHTKYYTDISEALKEDEDNEYIIPDYNDVYHVHVKSKKNITLGGNKSIDLNGETVVFNGTIKIPSGMTLTIFNGTVICESTVFNVRDGGSLVIGKAGYDTKVIGDEPIAMNSGCSVTMAGAATVEWRYTDHLSNTYVLTTTSMATDTEKYTVTMTGSGTVTDSDKNVIAQCTEFSQTRGSYESAKYSGYAELSTFKFKGYVFEELGVTYTQPDDMTVVNETANGYSYVTYSFDCVTNKSDYSIEIKSISNAAEVIIDVNVIGLKPFSSVEKTHLDDVVSAVQKVKQYLNTTLPTKVNLNYYVSYEHYNAFKNPSKIFTKDIIDCASKNGYNLSLNVSNIVLTVDTKNISSNEFSVLFKRNSNEFMNDQQLAAAGNITGYSIGYSGEVKSDVSFTVSMNVSNKYKDPAFYKINGDGKAEEMSTVFKNGTVTFTAKGTGVYIITEKNSFVTAKAAPTAKTRLLCNGSEQELIVPASGVSYGVAEYSLDGKNWSTDVPTAKDVGEYHVYYRYVATDDAHIGSTTNCIDVKIVSKDNEKADNVLYITIGVIAAICAVLIVTMLIRRKI